MYLHARRVHYTTAGKYLGYVWTLHHNVELIPDGLGVNFLRSYKACTVPADGLRNENVQPLPTSPASGAEPDSWRLLYMSRLASKALVSAVNLPDYA